MDPVKGVAGPGGRGRLLLAGQFSTSGGGTRESWFSLGQRAPGGLEKVSGRHVPTRPRTRGGGGLVIAGFRGGDPNPVFMFAVEKLTTRATCNHPDFTGNEPLPGRALTRGEGPARDRMQAVQGALSREGWATSCRGDSAVLAAIWSP